MRDSEWRAARNEKSLARLNRALPAIFPPAVMLHALARPFIPPTPRLAIDSYWRAHPLRADRLARALACRSGAPEGWTWRLGKSADEGLATSFRSPPAPFREARFCRGPGHCCVCGQPVYRFGWHADLWERGPNKNAVWHPPCVIAWKFWHAPTTHLALLKRHQRHRCAVSGARLWRSAEVDHAVPLYEVWRARRETPWPALLGFWGLPNLRVINRDIHLTKCAAEAGQRARLRLALATPPDSAIP